MAPPNKKQLKLTRLLSFLFDGVGLRIKSSFEADNLKCLNNVELLELHDYLFDFGRYHALLNTCHNNEIVIAFNDTFGNGRNLNYGAILFILISILLVKFNLVKVAGPVDRDQNGCWLSPYFFIGRAEYLQNLNWVDFKLAKRSTSYQVKSSIHHWLQNGWRNRSVVSRRKMYIKLKTLYLERALIDFNNVKVFSFSRRSIFRQINRFL